MNLIDELQSLDANDVGRWPLPFRVAVIAIVFMVASGLGIYFFIVNQIFAGSRQYQARNSADYDQD